METTVPFGRAISVRQLPFAVLSDNFFLNRCIYACILDRRYFVESSIHLIEEHCPQYFTGVQASGVIIVSYDNADS